MAADESQSPGIAGAYSAPDRVVQALRKRIQDGIYPPGTLLPTERDLAQEIGVSRPVIRVALEQMSALGWIDREPRHRPRVVRSLPTSSSFSPRNGSFSRFESAGLETSSQPLQAIAAVLPMDPSYPAAYDIQRGIQRALHRSESPHRLVVFDSMAGSCGLDASYEREILAGIAREEIAGVILWPIGGVETSLSLRPLQEKRVPIVFVDRYPDSPDTVPCDFVGASNRAGAQEAVNSLIRMGHRRIAHITSLGKGPEGMSIPVRERYEGYRAALTHNGLPFEEEWIGGADALLARLRASASHTAPTAMFAVNDASAHSFLRKAAGIGLHIPEDISVLGFDDLDRYSAQEPFLTSMHLPFETIGDRAADLLLHRLRHTTAPDEPRQHILLSTKLITRATCAAPTSGTPASL